MNMMGRSNCLDDLPKMSKHCMVDIAARHQLRQNLKIGRGIHLMVFITIPNIHSWVKIRNDK